MPEDWRTKSECSNKRSVAEGEDSVCSSFWREADLIGRGLVGGLKKGAIESYHDPMGTALRVGEILLISALVRRSHAGGLTRIHRQAFGLSPRPGNGQ